MSDKTDLDTAQRVSSLAEQLWGGNQSKMAKDLGLSQPAVHRAVKGARRPSYDLLIALAKDGRVNVGWVLTGEGDPFVKSQPNLMLPVFTRPSVKPLGQASAPMSAQSFAVAPHLFRASRYWYRVSRSDEIVEFEKVSVGDLLLVETDPQYWSGSFWFASQLALVRTKEAMKFAELEEESDEEGNRVGLIANFFGHPSRPRPAGRRVQSGMGHLKAELADDDIMGLVLQLVRPLE